MRIYLCYLISDVADQVATENIYILILPSFCSLYLFDALNVESINSWEITA